MRRSKEAAADTRQRILKETGALIRAQGVERVSVADLMRAADMTHGGFYKHFSSKEELVAEAIAGVFEEHHSVFFGGDGSKTERRQALRDYVEAYLSPEHIQVLTESCAIPALASDTAKFSAVAQEAMASGTKETINHLAKLATPSDDAQKERQAIELLCTLVGTVLVARALSGESAMQNKVLEVMRRSPKVARLLSQD